MLKTLLAQVKEYKKASILAPLWVAMEVVLEVFIPFMLSIMIDKGLNAPGGNMQVVIITAIIMLIAATCSLFSGFQSGKYAAYASAGFAKNLRKAQYEKIEDFSFKEIDKYSTSSLITRMTTDVTNVQNAYMMIIRTCVRAPMMLVATLFMTSLLNKKIAMYFVATIILLGIVLFGVIFIVRPIFNRLFKEYDRLNQGVQENVSGIRVVKSFVREDYEITQFHKRSKALFSTQRLAENILTINAPAMQFSTYALILLISWTGAHMIVSHTMTTGQLMSLFTYVMNILMSLMMLSMVVVMVSMSIASGSRISKVINQKSSLTSPENGLTTVANGDIRFNHVTFDYGKNDDENQHVLEDINLHIPSGSTLGILGATGSSKSSLVQLIPRLYDVSEGSVEVAQHNVKDYDLEVLRDNVAMVLQKNVLFSGTIKENMRWGNAEASDEECIAAAKLANAHDFIKHLEHGYQTQIDGSGESLSQGQRQLISIARAAVANPPVLILDEATSSIDTRTEKIVQDGMDKLMHGRTVFVIAHRLSTIQNANAIMVLDQGRIIERGNHEDLLEQKGIYYQLYTGAFEME